MRSILVLFVSLFIIGTNTFAQTVIFNFPPQGVVLYPTDSGYAFGHNRFGLNAFAERFDFSGADSSIRVLGVHLDLGGHYNEATLRTITVKAWEQSERKTIQDREHLFYGGIPGNAIDSAIVPLQQLNIDNNTGGTTSGVSILFPQPTTFLNDSFYVGYELSSYDYHDLNGDTIGLYSTQIGSRAGPAYTVSDGDTVIKTKNMIHTHDNRWVDIAFDPDTAASYSTLLNLALAVIVDIHYTTGIAHVTDKNLSLYGAFPNPCSSNANIKFSLKENSDVTINIISLDGKLLTRLFLPKVTKGEHIVPIETENFSNGNYLYEIQTSYGNQLISKLSVQH